MKKQFTFLAAGLLAVSCMAACSSSSGTSETQKSTTAASQEKPSEKAEANPDYPKKDIQIVVPFGAGGGSDTLARALITYIDLPVSMVAVNVEGADGMVGAMQCYNSKPDGYTIMTHNTTDVLSYTLSGTTEIALYDELVNICDLVSDYNVIATNKKSGWSDIEELVQYAKANPGKVKWSCTGSQNIDYATTYLIVEALGLSDCVTIVPYDGGSESQVALLGDHVQVTTNTSSDLAGSIASGDIVPLMVVNDERIQALPDVPTTVENNLDITFGMPRGFYAPKGTPQEIVDYIAQAMKDVSENAEFVEAMKGLGLEVSYKTGEEAHQRTEEWAEAFTPVFEQMMSAN